MPNLDEVIEKMQNAVTSLRKASVYAKSPNGPKATFSDILTAQKSSVPKLRSAVEDYFLLLKELNKVPDKAELDLDAVKEPLGRIESWLSDAVNRKVQIESVSQKFGADVDTLTNWVVSAVAFALPD